MAENKANEVKEELKLTEAEEKEQKPVMKELDEKEMKSVAGGETTRDGFYFWGHVGQYDGVIGKHYWVTKDDLDSPGQEWFGGVLEDSWEETVFLWATKRMHKFRIQEESAGYYESHIGFPITVEGSDYTMWNYRKSLYG